MQRIALLLLPISVIAWPLLADAALKGIVLGIIVALATVLLRSRSASVRHAVWLAGMAGLIVLPLAASVMPQWRILPEWYGWEFEAGSNDRLATSGDSVRISDVLVSDPNLDPARVSEFTLVESQVQEAETDTLSEPLIVFEKGENAVSETPRDSLFIAPMESDQEQLALVQSEWVEPKVIAELTNAGNDSDRSESSLAVWLVALWLAGCGWMLLRLLIGQLSLRRLFHNAERLDSEEWQARIASLCQELGFSKRSLQHPVSVWKLSQRIIPMAWGVFRPRVILPSDAGDWNEDRMRAVLLHELAHIRRRDCLTQWIAETARVLHWFNPLSWLAVARMRVERERACDDLVLSLGLAPTAYADQLVKMTAEYPSFRHQLPLTVAMVTVAMARPSGLEQRVRRILDATLDRRRLSRIGLTAMLGLLVSLLLPLSMLDRSVESAEASTLENVAEEDERESEETPADRNEKRKDVKLVYEVTEKTGPIEVNGKVFCEARLVNEGDEPVTVYYGDYAHPLMYRFDIRHDETKERIPATRMWPRDRLPPFGNKKHFKTIQPGKWVSYTICFGPIPGANTQRVHFNQPGRYLVTPSFSVDTNVAFDRKTGKIEEVEDAWTGTVDGLPFFITVKKKDDEAAAGVEAKGKVVSFDGKPVAGAMVQVMKRMPGFGSFRGFYEDIADQTYSDTDGRFRFRRLPAESSQFRFSAWIPGRPSPMVSVANNGKRQLPETTLTIGRGHTISGRVVDWKGRPLQFARITNNSWTDKHGRFEIPGMPKLDEYSLWLYRPGFLDQSRKVSFEDATRGDLQFSMMPEAAAEIAGTATFADGSPIALQEIRFKLKPLEPKDDRDQYERGVRAETDVKGRFKVVLPDRRAYSAAIETLKQNDHNIGPAWKIQLQRMAAGMGPLNLKFEDRRRIRLEIAHSNNLPESLRLFARCRQGNSRTVEEQKITVDTKEVVFDRLGPDKYRVEVGVETAGHLNWNQEVIIPEKTTGPIDEPIVAKLTIPALHFGDITARFLMPDGKTPYANKRVWIDSSGSWGGVVTDVDGRFTAKTVPVGWVSLTPRPDRKDEEVIAELGFRSVVKPDRLTDLGTFTVKRIADEFGEVKGTLKFDDGTPVIGAQISSGKAVGETARAPGGRQLGGFFGPPIAKQGRFHVRLRKGWQDLTFNLSGAAGWPDPKAKPNEQLPGFVSFGNSFDHLAVRVEIKPGEVAQRDIVLRRGKLHRVKVRWKMPKQPSLTLMAQVVQPGIRLQRQVSYEPRKNEVLIEDIPDGKLTVRLYAWDLGYFAAKPVTFGEPEAVVEFDPADSGSVAVRVFGPDNKPIRGLGVMVSNAIGGQFVPGVRIPPADPVSGERHKPAYGKFEERDDGTLILGGLGRSRYRVTITGPNLKIEQHLDLTKSKGAAFDFIVDEKGQPTLRKAKPDLKDLQRDLKGRDVGLKARAMRYLSQAGKDAAPLLHLVVDQLDDPTWAWALIPTTGTTGGSIGSHAEQSLRMLGRDAVPALIPGLSDDSAKIRAKCAELVGYTGDGRAVPELIRLLEDPELSVRNPVSSALGRMGDAAVPPILDVLESGSVDARLAASLAAGYLKGEKLTAALIRQLDEKDVKLREYAAYALGRRDNSGFAEELVLRLNDPNQKIRQQISQALMRLGNGADVALRQALASSKSEVQLAAANALFVAFERKPDAKNIPPILKAMDDQDVRLRRMATNVISGYMRSSDDPDPFFEALSKRLHDDDTDVRKTAASTFTHYASTFPRDRRPVPALLESLGRENPKDLHPFIQALGSYRDSRAVEPLLKLARQNGDVALWSAKALANIKDRRTLKLLRKHALQSNDQSIIQALGEMRDTESIPLLIQLLTTGKFDARVAAARALQYLPDKAAVQPLMNNLNQWGFWTEQRYGAHAFMNALVATRDERVPEFLLKMAGRLHGPQSGGTAGAWLVMEGPTARDAVMERVGGHPAAGGLLGLGAAAIPALEKGLQSDNVQTREVCAWVVFQMNFFNPAPPEAFSTTVPILLSRLDDPSVAVRRSAARALGELRVRRAVPRLALLYRSPVPPDFKPPAATATVFSPDVKPVDVHSIRGYVRRDALLALGQIGGSKALTMIQDGLKDESQLVQFGAATGLTYMKGDAARNTLLSCLDHPSEYVRRIAIRRLGWSSEKQAVEPLISLLQEKDAPALVQQSATEALGRIGDPQAIRILKTLVTSDDLRVKQQAAISLALLGDGSGLGVFQEMLAHNERKVRSEFHLLMTSAVSWSEDGPRRRIRNPEVLALIRHHVESDRPVRDRDRLLRALKGNQDKETVAVFMKATTDLDPGIRQTGLANLAILGAEEHFAVLARALDDQDRYVRSRALDYIAGMNRDEDVPLLKRMLNDRDEDVRGQTIESIARRTNEKQAAELLRGIRDEPSPKLRIRTKELLGQLER